MAWVRPGSCTDVSRNQNRRVGGPKLGSALKGVGEAVGSRVLGADAAWGAVRFGVLIEPRGAVRPWVLIWLGELSSLGCRLGKNRDLCGGCWSGLDSEWTTKRLRPGADTELPGSSADRASGERR